MLRCCAGYLRATPYVLNIEYALAVTLTTDGDLVPAVGYLREGTSEGFDGPVVLLDNEETGCRSR